ncbi:MAG: DEAD/DEAH box helicase [Planctomycetota bacterium]
MTFDRLHPALQHHIVNSLGWSDLREVQTASIDAYQRGANVVLLAPTAGGKTEAAFFPAISEMLAKSWVGLSVLYVSPIRALLNNQEERLRRYFALVGRTAACWHGDTSDGDKRRMHAEPPDCLLTTPESIEVLLVSTKIDHRRFFQNLRVVIIDELHAFAGDDRGWHLLAVLSRLAKLAGRDLQRIGLSATVGNPSEMLDWVAAGSPRPKALIRPGYGEVKDADVQLDYVGSLANAAKVISLLHHGEKRLVFCDSRARVEQLAQLLRDAGIDTFVSHSSLAVDERRRAEEAFAQRQNCVIVATSALELGLDVGDLDRVIQIDAPATVSSFLQRMGRTGRRSGTRSNCLFLATQDEGLLRAAAIIDLWESGYVEPVQPPPMPFHIVAQQLMALVLQTGGVGRRAWFEWVSGVPAFSVMEDQDVAALVEHMVATGILWESDGILSFGVEGEAKYGRKNFMELLSVFTSPPLFKVVTGRKELGHVHESTFYKRGDEAPTVLVLAGRSWLTNHVDWKRRIAYVEPTRDRGRSRWTGEGQFLSFALCQAIREVLEADASRPTWSSRAEAQLGLVREDYPVVAEGTTSLTQLATGELVWWTFAGGVANTVISDALVHTGVPEARPENLSIRISSRPGGLEEMQRRVVGLQGENRLEPVHREDALRGTKFGECLPVELAERVFRTRFNDPSAVAQTLATPVRFGADTTTT